MINVFNNLSIVGKTLVIVLIAMFIILIALIIYLCVKGKKDDNEKLIMDTDFFDDLKNQDDNTKSVFVDNIDINKVNEVAKKIEPEKKEDDIISNIDINKLEVTKKINTPVIDKFDIGAATKQMEEDIENNNIDLTEYEVEQEEKAIISYTELLNKVKNNLETRVNVQTVGLEEKKELEQKEPEEFSYNTEILDFSDLNDALDNEKEVTTTLFKQDDLKEMLNIKNVDTTLYSSDEFLKALKDLRDSLE